MNSDLTTPAEDPYAFLATLSDGALQAAWVRVQSERYGRMTGSTRPDFLAALTAAVVSAHDDGVTEELAVRILTILWRAAQMGTVDDVPEADRQGWIKEPYRREGRGG